MALAQVVNGIASELDGPNVTFSDGARTSLVTVSRWTEEERNARGLYTIVDDPIPEGKVATSNTLEFAGGVVSRHWVLTDAPPPPVPSQVTPAQAKAQLFEAGLLDQAEAAVAGHPYALVRIYWDSASAFERNNAYINGIGIELGLDDAALDALFTSAAQRVF